jgi:multidrug resistance efflux pump
MKNLTNSKKILLTAVVILIALAASAAKYLDYLANPWTRDGQVQAQVIQITPRVSAPVVNLPIRDNQFVRRGDLLFELDPRTFAAALAQAEASLDKTRDDIVALAKEVEAAEAQVEQFDAQIAAATANITRTKAELQRTKVDLARSRELLKRGNVSKRRHDQAVADYESAVSNQNNALATVTQARASKLQAIAGLAKARANLGAPGEDNAQLRAGRAAVLSAKLNLEFTRVTAPVDGFVTNLNLRIGSQGVANQPVLALVDTDSYWVDGYFRETFTGDIRPGDEAVVTLMSYPDTPLTGRVDSIGWGIAQEDGSTGDNLLPNVNPTFEWIRLAQRVPVRIQLDKLPEGIELRVGTTASVMVRTGTGGKQSNRAPVAVPKMLQ